MQQSKPEEAKKILSAVILTIEKQNDNPFLSALAYENLSRYYFVKSDYNSAINELEKGLSEIENLSYNPLKYRIYASLSKNYLALHNNEKYHQYNKLYVDSRAQIDVSTKEAIRYIVKLVENSQNKSLEFQKQNQSSRFWILASILLLIIISLFIYFLALKSKNKDLKKQFEFFEKQKKKEKAIQTYTDLPKEDEILNVNKVSKEKEDEILQKLEEWEETDEYLSKNMSLSMLSAQIGVNTKYLSEVINTTKGKNFNGYINELRINHIAHLLKTEPTYLNYKVSYLAEYSGFSSHSAFTTIFKSVTGMSPNVYIQEISKSRTS
jgi:AraC-like DNA-binding protein